MALAGGSGGGGEGHNGKLRSSQGFGRTLHLSVGDGASTSEDDLLGDEDDEERDEDFGPEEGERKPRTASRMSDEASALRAHFAAWNTTRTRCDETEIPGSNKILESPQWPPSSISALPAPLTLQLADDEIRQPLRTAGLDKVFDPHVASALADVFGADGGTRLFQPLADDAPVLETYTLKEPKILHGYLFGGLIGEGSYAKVKEVVEERTLVRRAIKIVKFSRVRKIPNGIENVENEWRLLTALSHPNVIRLVDTFRAMEEHQPASTRKLYMVFEYCTCSLQQLLDHADCKRLPTRQTHAYFRQLVDGLDYLHAVQIVHKDIKPGNLLLSLDGLVKICDFGVAERLRNWGPEEWCELVQGTPKFQPPEAVAGEAKRFRAFPMDVWSSGVTLYNLLSGEYPYEGDLILQLYEAIVNQPLQMPKGIQLSEDAVALLRGMLAKPVAERWTLAKVRESAWFHTPQTTPNDVRWVSVPAVNGQPAHRPLSVYPLLEQKFGHDQPPETVDAPAAPAPFLAMGQAIPATSAPPSQDHVILPAHPQQQQQQQQQRRQQPEPRRQHHRPGWLRCIFGGSSSGETEPEQRKTHENGRQQRGRRGGRREGY